MRKTHSSLTHGPPDGGRNSFPLARRRSLVTEELGIRSWVLPVALLCIQMSSWRTNICSHYWPLIQSVTLSHFHTMSNKSPQTFPTQHIGSYFEVKCVLGQKESHIICKNLTLGSPRTVTLFQSSLTVSSLLPFSCVPTGFPLCMQLHRNYQWISVCNFLFTEADPILINVVREWGHSVGQPQTLGLIPAQLLR